MAVQRLLNSVENTFNVLSGGLAIAHRTRRRTPNPETAGSSPAGVLSARASQRSDSSWPSSTKNVEAACGSESLRPTSKKNTRLSKLKGRSGAFVAHLEEEHVVFNIERVLLEVYVLSIQDASNHKFSTQRSGAVVS